MFQNFGFTEILMVLGAVLLLFGAKRIPQVGRHLGEGIGNFYRAVTGGFDDDKTSLPGKPPADEPASLPPPVRDPDMHSR